MPNGIKGKKLRKESEHGSRRNEKAARNFPNTTAFEVNFFYLADDNKRVMSGMKDYILIVKNGKRTQEQKMLLLFNLNDLHKQFKEKFPKTLISLLKFR